MKNSNNSLSKVIKKLRKIGITTDFIFISWNEAKECGYTCHGSFKDLLACIQIVAEDLVKKMAASSHDEKMH